MQYKKISFCLALLLFTNFYINTFEKSFIIKTIIPLTALITITSLFVYNKNYIISYLWYKLFYSADPNIQDHYEATPLHLAVQGGNIKMVQILINDKRTNPNIQDYYEATPLYLAVQRGNIEMVQILINDKRTDQNIQDNYGNTPLHLAVRGGKIEMVQIIINDKRTDPNIRDRDGYTPLHRAVRGGKIEMVKILVNDKKTDPNIQDKYGDTPLHLDMDLNRIDIVKILLSNAKTNSNIRDKYGNTSLHRAVQEDNIEMVQIIINDKRTDPNIQDNDGDTPLHMAVLKGNTGVLQILLSNSKTNINIQDKNGYTPLHKAILSGSEDIILLLLHHSKLKIDENIYTERCNSKAFQNACNKGLDISTIELIFNTLKININHCDCDGNTLLYSVCNGKNIDLVQLLLKKGANITLKNKYGDTPLIIAATNDINIVNMLITYGANISEKNQYNKTVLYLALSHNIIKNIDQLNYCQYDHNKRAAFLNNELHQISTITNNDKSTYNKVNDFISWCIGNGAEINTRNTNKLRPVDVAENLYNYALKHSINEEVTHKEKIYHLFLNHTPYCFDAIVYSLLRRTVDNYDVIKIIMGYYKALTIDREIALRINSNLNFYDYSMKKEEKKEFQKNLLNDICTQKGYYNPYKALPIM